MTGGDTKLTEGCRAARLEAATERSLATVIQEGSVSTPAFLPSFLQYPVLPQRSMSYFCLQIGSVPILRFCRDAHRTVVVMQSDSRFLLLS